MSDNKSDHLSSLEEAAMHELREELAIHADQLQEDAAESHSGVCEVLYFSPSESEFFMLHSTEDGRLTGSYHFGFVPIFRADRRTPAEISEVLIEYLKGFDRLRQSLSVESIFDDETYDRVGHEMMQGFVHSFDDKD